MSFNNNFSQDDYFRSNPNLKSPTYKQFITKDTFNERYNELKLIFSDINYFAKKYFYIISLDKGKCLINPYKKQCELLDAFTKYRRNIVLASRQVRYKNFGKSTTYSIYILWYILTNKDKHVLICANKLDTAIEILQRIQMAYQQLPMWLKPGVITWNKKKIEFSNGCSVTATATSESSGRGLSINCIGGNQTIDILENGIVYTLSLKDAYKQYKINSTAKILTDTGWSDFFGIIKYSNRQTINVTINKKHIICTPDHKIFNGKQFVTADTFPYKKNNNEDVYDIINVKKNNRFLINKDILVHNCLVLDEFAFISPGIEQSFMASVFPIISSSKNSKVIIVSTPNGMNNEFYRLWSQALLENIDQKKIKDTTWHSTKIHWSDFPGRDQHWKEIQLTTMNNNITRWNQEFQCKFLGSVVTLIEAQKIQKFKAEIINKINIKKPYQIQLHSEIQQIKINIYMPPQPGHAYIIGADPSTGDGGDFHAMTIWDITNMYNIELVADFHSNNLQPKKFAYILAKSGFLYNCAYIAIENNGVSYATIENLVGDFEYENIIHLGGNPKTNIAIHSTPQLKLSACLTAKQLIEDPLRKINIYNGILIDQMERFQKRTKMGKQPSYGCYNSHDDLIMSMIWAFYCLKFEILENYYTIRKYATNKLGNTIPLIVISDENYNTPQIKEIMENLDNKFSNINKINKQNIQETIENEQVQLMNNFIQNNTNIIKESTQNIDNNNNTNEDTLSNNFDFFSFTT